MVMQNWGGEGSFCELKTDKGGLIFVPGTWDAQPHARYFAFSMESRYLFLSEGLSVIFYFTARPIGGFTFSPLLLIFDCLFLRHLAPSSLFAD